MPSNPAFPGVFIEEVSNGAQTITGVATSVTAFVGHASRGPLNQAFQLLSFADFERHFGGLEAKSELSYAVRQFFLNGGTEAWVVRLAKNAIAAAQADTSNSQTADVTLAGGHEESYATDEAYSLFIAAVRPARASSRWRQWICSICSCCLVSPIRAFWWTRQPTVRSAGLSSSWMHPRRRKLRTRWSRRSPARPCRTPMPRAWRWPP